MRIRYLSSHQKHGKNWNGLGILSLEWLEMMLEWPGMMMLEWRLIDSPR